MRKIKIFRIPDDWSDSEHIQPGTYRFIRYMANEVPLIECPWGWPPTYVENREGLDPNKRYYYLTKQKDPYWRFLNGIVICGIKGEKDENR